MTRLQAMRAQQVGPLLLLNQLLQCVRCRLWQHDVRQNPFWGAFIKGADWRIHTGGARSRWSCNQMLREPISYDVVLALAFLRDHGFHRAAEADLVSLGASADEVEQEVGPGHDRRSMADEVVAGPGWRSPKGLFGSGGSLGPGFSIEPDPRSRPSAPGHPKRA